MPLAPPGLTPNDAVSALLESPRYERDLLASAGAGAAVLPSQFSMAFQPIIDFQDRSVFAYEALVRGLRNEPAASILDSPSGPSREKTFDARCNGLAVDLAEALGLRQTGAALFLNFRPIPAAPVADRLSALLETTERSGFPLDHLVIEITESEPVFDPLGLERVFARFRSRGVRSAIDDFGAGYAGLSLLAAFHPDLLKIDISLIHEIHTRPRSRAIVRSIVTMGRDLGTEIIAEGIEHPQEAEVLRDLGIRYMQGNLFAEPGFEVLPLWPTSPTSPTDQR